LFSLLAGLWLFNDSDKHRFRNITVFAVVWLMLYAPWLLWLNGTVGLGSHATSGLTLSGETMLRAGSRVAPALTHISAIWGDIKLYNVVLGASLVSIVAILCNRGMRSLMIVPLGLLGGYFVIVIFHHAEIHWLVGTAWNRLTLHGMPLLAVVLALVIGSNLNKHSAG
jgi:hypothetical protein